MNNKDILISILEKAINNGYNCAWWLCEFNVCDSKGDGLYFSECANLKVALEKLDWHKKTFNKRPAKLWINPKIEFYYQIIFSHEFAKAFWGEDFYEITDARRRKWQYHLHQMILEKEPLKYLEKFL